MWTAQLDTSRMENLLASVLPNNNIKFLDMQ